MDSAQNSLHATCCAQVLAVRLVDIFSSLAAGAAFPTISLFSRFRRRQAKNSTAMQRLFVYIAYRAYSHKHLGVYGKASAGAAAMIALTLFGVVRESTRHND